MYTRTFLQHLLVFFLYMQKNNKKVLEHSIYFIAEFDISNANPFDR